MILLATRGYLILSALAFLWIGINTFRAPEHALLGLEMVPTTVTALSEVRANYGGMQMAIGLALLAGAAVSAARTPAIWLNLIITGGLVAGRLISWSLDGPPNSFGQILIGVELTGALVGIALLQGWAARGRASRQDES